MRVEQSDPFGIADTFSKFSHSLKIGQRVIVKDFRTKETRRGKITNITPNRYAVQLDDGGHFVHCMESELTPEDFPAGERQATTTAAPDAETSARLASARKRLSESTAGLELALAAGRVSDADAVLVKRSLKNIEGNSAAYSMDPFGEGEDPNVRTLEILAEKYAGRHGDTGDTFAKSANNTGGFFVGQRVRDKSTRRMGKVSRLLPGGGVEIIYDDGRGEGMYLAGYAEAVT